MNELIGSSIDVYNLEELPNVEEDLKYFACIGGTKNYQCILESKKLSRADIMTKYLEKLDKCHEPIYEDMDITIRQDAQIAIPGFYIVATKGIYKKISFMDIELYKKCLYFSSLICRSLKEEFNIERVFMYYDEHYNKPSSTHFWVMPIYENVIKEHNLNPTILNFDVWRYQELFEFQHSKDKIYDLNDGMKKVLKKVRR